MFRCGNAAWPPRPATVTWNDSAPAMMVPARVDTVPVPKCGITCIPNAASTPSSAPVLIMMSAPAPPSSKGWNTNLTVPLRPPASASALASSFAAPSSIAMWVSCPHACITPACLLRASKPSGSSIGNASMSVRSKMVGLPLPMVAMIPVVAKPDSYLMLFSFRNDWMYSDVLCSLNPSSGMRWRSRRVFTSQGCRLSASSSTRCMPSAASPDGMHAATSSIPNINICMVALA
mmetsp:Transcript_24540/g.72725  ORF Transcript_24540/g.72725 Transcript_24540/m.72725 type:complete len:233 (-) Transcript_24540:30-728(-)